MALEKEDSLFFSERGGGGSAAAECRRINTSFPLNKVNYSAIIRAGGVTSITFHLRPPEFTPCHLAAQQLASVAQHSMEEVG